MKKLIMIFIIIFSFISVGEAFPKNGLIWYKSYDTFENASKDIKIYGNSDGYLDLYNTSLICNIISLKKDNIKLNINAYCYEPHNDPEHGYVYDINVYGNDIIKYLQNELKIGHAKKFNKLIWSSLDQAYIYYN